MSCEEEKERNSVKANQIKQAEDELQALCVLWALRGFSHDEIVDTINAPVSIIEQSLATAEFLKKGGKQKLERLKKDLPILAKLKIAPVNTKPMASTLDMTAVIDSIRSRIQYEPEHLAICRGTADEFDLWEVDPEGHQHFPTWLCRVVEGEMRDHQDEEPDRLSDYT